MQTRLLMLILVVLLVAFTVPLSAQVAPAGSQKDDKLDLDVLGRRLEAAKASAAKKEQDEKAAELQRKAAAVAEQREAERKAATEQREAERKAADEEQAKRRELDRSKALDDDSNNLVVPIALTIQPFGLSVRAAKTHAVFEHGMLERVIASDLNRSGEFSVEVGEGDDRKPTNGTQGASTSTAALLLVGRIDPGEQNGQVVQFELTNRNGERLLGLRIASRDVGELRGVAHQIADVLFEKLIGTRGVAWTRIAYVLRSKSPSMTFTMMVSDADGFNPQKVVTSKELLSTPTWSPDGLHLAYVSGETGKPALYYQEVSTGARRRILENVDFDACPSFSPDGHQIALNLRRDTARRLFRLDVEDSHLVPMSDSDGDDSDPSWLSDGRIVFARHQAQGSSIQSMLPTTGQLSAIEGVPPGLTRMASVLDGGKAWIAGARPAVGGQQVVIYELFADRVGHEVQLSPPIAAGRVSFAPNGHMVLYSVHEEDKDVLYAASANGRVRQRLRSEDGDVFDGAWAPYRTR